MTRVTSATLEAEEVEVMPEIRATENEPIASNRKLTVSLGGHGEKKKHIRVAHGGKQNAFVIELNRTIRVPDNRDINSLPPGLGTFPLFRVRDYAHNMPEDMAKKGGIFFPMYQREAMWINFVASAPFAVKIYVGGVNAVSGLPMTENETTKEKRRKMLDDGKSVKDYMVVPGQRWLDGIASEDGKIRQFVAQPKGSGFSVEAQVTGEEKVGGIQIEIIPVKKKLPTEFDVRYEDRAHKVITRTFNLAEKGITAESTWLDVKKHIREEFDVATEDQILRIHDQKPGFSQISVDFSDGTKLGDVYFPPKFSTLSVANAQAYSTSKCRARGTFLGDSSFSFGNPAPSSGGLFGSSTPSSGAFGSSQAQSVSVFGNATASPFGQPKQLGGLFGASAFGGSSSSLFGQASQTVGGGLFGTSSSATTQNASSQVFSSGGLGSFGGVQSLACVDSALTYGASSPTYDASSPQEMSAVTLCAAPPPQVKEMGLAAGGLITQTIEADTQPADVWDIDASVMMNLQILDVESFCAVTGKPAPETPVTAESYANHGYPFFEIWGQEKTGIKGEFSEVKSVAQIEAERAQAEGKEYKQEESVPMRVVPVGSFRSTFRPVVVIREETIINRPHHDGRPKDGMVR